MPSCRLCGAGPGKQEVRASYVFGGSADHRFWQCSHCDAIYLFPVPSLEQEKLFYKKE